MPKSAAVIAALITDRPLCLKCIAEKVGLTTEEAQSYLRRIETMIVLKRAIERCRTCRNETDVVSIFRPK